MTVAEDRRLMDAALGLARRRVGCVGARPAVGAVIAVGGRIIGRGATGPGGRPHAETVALDQAYERYGKDAVRGATAYVTLEPCAHHGRTPPCADALVSAGIGRVVAPMEDPDPRVSGRGFAALRRAGVAVEVGLGEREAREVNRGFLSRITRARPWVTLKLAVTLDGRIATASGESRWITGPEARRRVHLMRLRSDAVLIGSGTARADDPMLDVRGFGPSAEQPIRVVADSGLSLSPESRLVASATDIPLVLLHRPNGDPGRRDALAARNVRMIEVANGGGSTPVAMDPAMALLAEEGINSLLCEGGGRLASSLLDAGLVDELAVFSAGKVLGAEGAPAVGALPAVALAYAPRFRLASVEAVGGDSLSLWRRF